MADSKEKLFSDFPAVSTEQWMEKTVSYTHLDVYKRQATIPFIDFCCFTASTSEAACLYNTI